MMDYEGERAESEIGACNVYRWDANTKEITAIKATFDKPNGLAFSTDEKLLYVSDTGGTHTENGPAHIRCFTLTADGKDVAGEIGIAPVFIEPVFIEPAYIEKDWYAELSKYLESFDYNQDVENIFSGGIVNV